jgi:hypothetical protein
MLGEQWQISQFMYSSLTKSGAPMVRHLKNLGTGNFSQQLPQAAPGCDEE